MQNMQLVRIKKYIINILTRGGNSDCISCKSSKQRVLNGTASSTCDCNSGYYDDGSNM